MHHGVGEDEDVGVGEQRARQVHGHPCASVATPELRVANRAHRPLPASIHPQCRPFPLSPTYSRLAFRPVRNPTYDRERPLTIRCLQVDSAAPDHEVLHLRLMRQRRPRQRGRARCSTRVGDPALRTAPHTTLERTAASTIRARLAEMGATSHGYRLLYSEYMCACVRVCVYIHSVSTCILMIPGWARAA